MCSFVKRAYAGATDLRQMEQLLANAYGSTLLRVGDLSWLSREHTHRELSLDIQLVEDSTGQPVAWAYFRPNGEFNVFIMPEVADADDGSVLNGLLDFVEQAWRDSVAAGDPPVTLNTYCIDPSRSAMDRALAVALQHRGFVLDDSGSSATLVGSLAQLPEPCLPPGFHFDWVRTPALRVGRVEAHRAALAPSELSIKKYERLQRTWAYRPELDRLVVTDAGEVVAFCTAWLDTQNASGLLEPVGTHPDHQRRGLARAVCLDACRALRAAGARTGQVGFNTEAGFATYSSLGFTSSGPDLIFTKEWQD
jgi:ribosomal protein S18 acetylase RimI-like enzyme